MTERIWGYLIGLLFLAVLFGFVALFKCGGWGQLKCTLHGREILREVDRIVKELVHGHNVYLYISKYTEKRHGREMMARKYNFKHLIFVITVFENGDMESFAGHPDGNSIHQFHARYGLPDFIAKDVARVVVKEAELRSK